MVGNLRAGENMALVSQQAFQQTVDFTVPPRRSSARTRAVSSSKEKGFTRYSAWLLEASAVWKSATF